MPICYIFAALKTEKIPYLPVKEDFVIAADKGLEITKKLNIKPDVVIGDFDSLGFVPNEENIRKLPIEKDDTDVGDAIKYAFSLGYKDFIIYGALGGLIDHTFANLQLAVYISKNGGKSVFVGDGIYATAITDSGLKIKNGKGRLSVFSSGDISKGVTLKGLKYSLSNAVLTNEYPLGVSNEFIDNEAEISVKSGTLIILSQSKI